MEETEPSRTDAPERKRACADDAGDVAARRLVPFRCSRLVAAAAGFRSVKKAADRRRTVAFKSAPLAGRATAG